jgi:hypothetical protein
LRSIRRTQFISSARVAYHFNYKLSEAFDLSDTERSLLLSVAVIEQEKFWSRLDDSLGTRLDIDSLLSTSKEENYEAKYVRLPLLQLAAPEVYQKVVEEVKKKVLRRKTAEPGTKEVGTLSVAEAKAFFKNLTKG